MESVDSSDYNYAEFRRHHLVEEVVVAVGLHGPRPSAPAPDFELPRVGGGTLLRAGHRRSRLHRALEELGAGDGRGVVSGGIDLVPHLLTTFTDGWRALERGRPQSTKELARALPGSVALLLVGRRLRPVLGPLALRARPLPSRTRAVLLGVASAALLLLHRRSRTRRDIAVDGRQRRQRVIPSDRRRRSNSSSSMSPRA